MLNAEIPTFPDWHNNKTVLDENILIEKQLNKIINLENMEI